MDEYFKRKRKIHPSCILPEDLNTTIWRYMDMYKFESLLKKKELYLCRGDIITDRFEGRPSCQQISAINDWLNKKGYSNIIHSEEQERENNRRKTFINCWCMGDYDFDLMWKGYVQNRTGVAIRSTVKSLQKICDEADVYYPLDITMVKYFDQAGGEMIEYIDRVPFFIHKDFHFKLDNELRIIHTPNIGDPIPEYIGLPVSLNDLIEAVVLKPGAEENDLNHIKELMNDAGLNHKPILHSRDDRDIPE